MKVQLELNFADQTWLNFWDSLHGNDVVCLIDGDKLMLVEYDDDGKELPLREITLSQYVRMVEERAKR